VALSRKRDSAMIWPGFVDALTVLLMVFMFVLTIFTVMQSALRDTITTQDTELDSLNATVAELAAALGLEQQRAGALQDEVGVLRSSLASAEADAAARADEVALLSGTLAAREADLAAAQGRIASFEAQVATLLAERDAARGEVTTLTASVADLQAAEQRLISQQEALNLALAQARDEIDAGTEAARLAAARREALEALIADLRARNAAATADLAAAQGALTETQAALTAEEQARLADQAALAALQDRLRASDAELTAMTLALEAQRRRAEETLTLLAAAETDAARAAVAAATEEERRAALLATAQAALAEEEAQSAEAQRRMAVLNQQIAALRGQLGELQGLLDASSARDAEAQVQLETLGSQLNAALAQVASEQRRRADLEAAERARLEAEAQDLARYRSEFFGQLSRLLEGREGVRVVGDRFVFSSEVLFTPGAADLAPEGRAQIAGVVEILNEVAAEIPPALDWIIRVDGHTDNVPLSGLGAFADNWELSQARALSVVRYMQDELGFPPDRMLAAGFGEYRPVAQGDSEQARAQNRRIELKLTER
jgi:chemotaxis protein MotB